jgi:hypothetical protein
MWTLGVMLPSVLVSEKCGALSSQCIETSERGNLKAVSLANAAAASYRCRSLYWLLVVVLTLSEPLILQVSLSIAWTLVQCLSLHQHQRHFSVDKMDTLRRLIGASPARLPPPPVESDDVYPIHMLDDSKTLKSIVVTWTLCFNDVLDADKLHTSLSALLEIGDWRKVGGRLRLKVRSL